MFGWLCEVGVAVDNRYLTNHIPYNPINSRTHALLLAVLRPLLALPASSSWPLPPKLWVALVRCLQPMAQFLAKAQDPALVQQVRGYT